MIDAIAIDGLVKKHKETLDEINISMVLTHDGAVALEEQGLFEQVSQLEDRMKEYVLMEQRLKNQSAVLLRLKTQPNKFTDATADVPAEYEAGLKEKNTEAQTGISEMCKKHQQYKKFRQDVFELNKREAMAPELEEGGVLVMATQEPSLLCPLTGTELDQPMKNPSCGHTYSRDAIMQHIEHKGGSGMRGRGPQVKCPVAGCGANVDSRTLEGDEDSEKRLRRAKSKPAAKKATQEEVLDI